MEKLVIRKCEKEDVPLILSFIKQIAEYEKLLDTLTVNEATLEESLFGHNSKAEVIIGYLNNEPIGYAVYFFNFSTFTGKNGLYLEDLFIKPEFRGKSFGKTLLHYLAQIAVTKNCGRMEWAVLDWNKPAIDFYKSIGAMPMDGWTIFRLDESSLKNFSDNPNLKLS